MNIRPFLAGCAAVLAPASALPALLLSTYSLPLPRLASPAAALILAWLLWPTLTLVWSMSAGLAQSLLGSLLTLPLAWVAGLAMSKEGKLDAFLRIWLPLALTLFVTWALLQGPNTFTGKPHGPFNDPNAFAALLNLLLLPLIAGYLAANLSECPPWRRAAWLALIGGGLLAQALVASRGATLAFLVALPILLWTARRLPHYTRKIVLLGVTALFAHVVGLALLTTYQPQAQGAVARLADTLQQGDVSRIHLYRAAWAMIQDHPWLGTGLGSFRLLYNAYRDPAEAGTAGGWVHNDYLQLWLEAGLPMLLLLLALVAWVMWRGVCALRSGATQGVTDLGYVSGLTSILLHASVNFLFYFPLIMFMLGLFLARLTPVPTGPVAVQERPLKLAAAGYALIIGLVLGGQVAIEALLGQARMIQQALLPWGIAYPRYELAWRLSILSPWHPVPQQVMGQELAELWILNPDPSVLAEARRRLLMSWERAPCYLPYANATYRLLAQPAIDPALRRQGLIMVAEALRCNPRHGLSHYYAGLFAETPETARRWWVQGFERSLFTTERLLLAAALVRLEHAHTGTRSEVLIEKMVDHLAHLEANPQQLPDEEFWTEAQYQLWQLGGKRYLELVQGMKS